MPETATLAQLHRILQIVMGWTDKATRGFRAVRGFRDMKHLVNALTRGVEARTALVKAA